MCPMGLGCVLIVIVVGAVAGMAGARLLHKKSAVNKSISDPKS